MGQSNKSYQKFDVKITIKINTILRTSFMNVNEEQHKTQYLVSQQTMEQLVL